MATQLNKKEHNIVTLTMDFTPEEFSNAMNKAFKKNAKRFSIPGFRKGKAPIGMIKRYYGEGVLYDDAIEECVNDTYVKAIEEYSLNPVSKPDLDIQEIGSEKGLKVVVTVTNKPEMTLGEYEGIEAVRPSDKVEDEAVEMELKRIAERNARMITVEDRGIEDGDTVDINYKGLKDDIPFDGGTAEHHELVIGSNSFIPGFESALIGHHQDEDVDIELTFPEEYHAKDLAGQPVVFKVHVNAIKKKEIPVLDDEFAKDVSEFDTLDEYRTHILEELEEKAKETADREFENNVIKAIVEKATVDLPEVMVETEAEQMFNEQARQLTGMGLSMEQYLGYLGQTKEEVIGHLKPDAKDRVLSRLAVEALVKKLNPDVSDEDIEAHYETLSKQYKVDVDRIKEVFGADTSMVKEDVKSMKAVKQVVSMAKPVAPQPTAEKEEQKSE